jgi:hypothetical protein
VRAGVAYLDDVERVPRVEAEAFQVFDVVHADQPTVPAQTNRTRMSAVGCPSTLYILRYIYLSIDLSIDLSIYLYLYTLYTLYALVPF